MDIQMELYRVFYTCARTLSFSRAAEALFVSQSSVSQSIKNLEKQLSVSLFTRTTKRVKLTLEGESLFKHVQLAFEQIRMGEDHLLSLKNLETGTLRIGVSDTISKYFLIPYLQQFHHLYPKIKIHIINRPSPQSIASILSSDIDVAIVNIQDHLDNPLLAVHTLTSFKDVFIAGEKFAHLLNKKLSVKDLATLPLISLEQNSTTRDFFDRTFSSLKSPLIPEIEIGSVDLIIELVRIGLGIGFVPAYTLSTHSAVFPLTLNFDYPQRAIALVHRKAEFPQVAVKKFLDLVQSSTFYTLQ
jgi:DNA-binding transcriptional LysR family regulator